MNRFIIFILPGMLLLASGASAKDIFRYVNPIYLKCNSLDKKYKNEGNYIYRVDYKTFFQKWIPTNIQNSDTFEQTYKIDEETSDKIYGKAYRYQYTPDYTITINRTEGTTTNHYGNVFECIKINKKEFKNFLTSLKEFKKDKAKPNKF